MLFHMPKSRHINLFLSRLLQKEKGISRDVQLLRRLASFKSWSTHYHKSLSSETERDWDDDEWEGKRIKMTNKSYQYGEYEGKPFRHCTFYSCGEGLRNEPLPLIGERIENDGKEYLVHSIDYKAGLGLWSLEISCISVEDAELWGVNTKEKRKFQKTTITDKDGCFPCAFCDRKFANEKDRRRHEFISHLCRSCQFSFYKDDFTLECSLKNNGLKCQYKRRDLHNG